MCSFNTRVKYGKTDKEELMQQISHLKYISFSSSGSHGFLFEGIIQAMEDNMPDFDSWLRSLKGVSGTSGGALMALIIALSIERQQRSKILTCLSDLTNVIRCPNISLMLNNFGIEDGASFRRIIQDILNLGGLSENSTMNDLHRLLRIDVAFVAHNLLDGKTVNLTVETVPELLVCDAVFASCCIPLVFAPVKFKEYVLCDGAISSYTPQVFPIDLTFHVIIPPWYYCKNIDTWMNFLRSFLVTCLVHQRPVIDSILASQNCINAYHPFMDKIGSLEKRMNQKMSDTIVHCGYIAGVLFIYDNLAALLFTLVRKHIDYTLLFHELIARSQANGAPEALDDENDSEDDQYN